MTEKLYYTDSHMTEFDAVVTECRALKGGYALILDRSAFFPEGGGQPADTGYIGSVRVTDVQELDGEQLHFCAAPVMTGQPLHCRLDGEQRLRRMQSHSGEHIVSGLAHKLFGCENVGFHMGADVMTIDLDRELTWEQLMQIETLANEAVRADLTVETWFPTPQELSGLEYRSKLELSGSVRIVEISGIDRCACCAPHVKRTGEIAAIKLLEAERHRGGVRFTLVCGMNALEDYRRKHDSVTAVSRLLCSRRGETVSAVERLLAEQARQKERIAALSMELARLRATACPETEGSICLFDSVLDEQAQRELVNMLTPKCGGIAAVFCGSDAEGYRYIIGSRSVDLRKNARAINALIDGRGGGSPLMISGRAAAGHEKILAGISGFGV